jgi:hypothetical protein
MWNGTRADAAKSFPKSARGEMLVRVIRASFSNFKSPCEVK